MKCAALNDQRSARDLELLPMLVESVDWLEVKDLESTRLPLILGALWLSADAAHAERLLRARTRSSRSTVVVPRFRGGDLAPVLGTPSAVTIRAHDAKVVKWNDGEEYRVSSVSHIHTVLHAGQWARTEEGSAVFSYRPHASAGLVVLCTANVTSRALGVDRGEQERLLGRILAECGGAAVHLDDRSKDGPMLAADTESFLRTEGDAGAALLLALVASGGDRTADLETVARERLGLRLDAGDARRLLDRLPEFNVDRLDVALRDAGWGAHLRLLRARSTAR